LSVKSPYQRNLFDTRYKAPGSNESSWLDLFKRVTHTVFDFAMALTPALTAGDRDAAFEAMEDARFIAGSPQLWNYGTTRRSARYGGSCYTGRMGDSLKDFRQADSDAEDVYVGSGGFGLLLDSVRPRGTRIKHCSEGAMGSMCSGGPALRVEGTTGYITGSGRARGALMLQLGVQHPDIIEFITRKTIQAIAWLDDWPANAVAVAPGLQGFVFAFSTKWVQRKNWPKTHEVEDELGEETLGAALSAGIVTLKNGRVVPLVTDWAKAPDDPNRTRPANRDWNIPLQNCNMSVRFSDEFMRAVEEDMPWVLQWSSPEVSGDEDPYTRTDVGGELRDSREYVAVTDDGTKAYIDGIVYQAVNANGDPGYFRIDVPRYQVILTTWEGVRANLRPNQNQWRDTDYARFIRTVVDPALEKYHGRIMARDLWDLFCRTTHENGDPGAVFSGTYERFQPVDTKVYGPRLSNPCSEYVNSAGGSCDLGSINCRACLPHVFMSPMRADGYYTADHWDCVQEIPEFKLYLENVEATARVGLRYLAAALEYNKAPVAFIEEMTREHFRTVGLGMMGLAEALMAFRVHYGSPCSERFAAATMSAIALAAWEESFELAKAGMATPKAWNPDRMLAIFGQRADYADTYGLGVDVQRRWLQLHDRVLNGEAAAHTCVTSVAPTGTISMIAGWVMSTEHWDATVSGSCEPPFSWVTHRRDNSGEEIITHDLWAHGSRGPWMKTAMDGITPEEHVRIHAAVCAFCCMSVSKTVNLPETATVDDISEVYKLSWRLGIPGTAPYRDQSKPMQVLTALECPSGECKVDLAALIKANQPVQATAK
jgi:ribonucleotide reductase alpha subunit